MATTPKKEAAKVYMLPEGRLINSSLFERDAYQGATGAPGKPMYKIELRFDPAQVTGPGEIDPATGQPKGTIEDNLADELAKRFGDAAADAWLNDAARTGLYINPLLIGDRLAANREAKGKAGDAYKGGIVIRASSGFNKDGVEGPGGLSVYGPDTSPITALEQTLIYPGCFGIAAVTISAYGPTDGSRGDKGVKFYLKAFQKTKDGPKLVTGADHSSLFKPVGDAGTAANDTGVRRRRVG
jgi:hypothetical protein